MVGGSGDFAAAIVAAVVLVMVGLVLVVLGERSRSGRLRRNTFAGVRTRTTLSSDAAWNAAQRASASFTIVAGCGAAFGGLVLALVALLGENPAGLADVASTIALATAGWASGWAIAGGVAGQRAAQKNTRAN